MPARCAPRSRPIRGGSRSPTRPASRYSPRRPISGPGPSGPIGFRTASGWVHADPRDQRAARRRGADSASRDDRRAGSPAHGASRARRRRRDHTRARVARGSVGDIEALGIGFDADADEHFFGFGERANAVEHRGEVVESYVSDGPYDPSDRALIKAVLPPPGFRDRDDSTYFPVPVAAVEPRLWRARRQRRDRLPPTRRPTDPMRGASRSPARRSTSPRAPARRTWRCASSPVRRPPTCCAATPRESAANRAPRRRGSSARGSSLAAASTSSSRRWRSCAPPTRRCRWRRPIFHYLPCGGDRERRAGADGGDARSRRRRDDVLQPDAVRHVPAGLRSGRRTPTR